MEMKEYHWQRIGACKEYSKRNKQRLLRITWRYEINDIELKEKRHSQIMARMSLKLEVCETLQSFLLYSVSLVKSAVDVFS